MGLKKLRGKKQKMFEALVSQLGNITMASKQAGINRTTHYVWLNNDSNYAGWVESVEDVTLDFVENSLFKLIKEGNVASTIFFLKTRGRVRGYVERQELVHESFEPVSIQINLPEDDEKKLLKNCSKQKKVE